MIGATSKSTITLYLPSPSQPPARVSVSAVRAAYLELCCCCVVVVLVLCSIVCSKGVCVSPPCAYAPVIRFVSPVI